MSSNPVMMKVAGGCIVLLLFVAPLFHGGVTEPSILALEVAALVAGLLWGADLIIHRRRPRIPGWIAAAALWILLQGWWMAYNAKSIFDASFMVFAPTSGHWEGLPGSADGPASFRATLRVCALLSFLCITCDLAGSTRWVRRMADSMALSGIAMAVIGLWQKSSQNSLKIWPVDKLPDTVFGTYWYHGNAASLLNMAWPLVLGKVMWAFQTEGRHLEKALWTAGLGAILAALLLNASKAGHIVAVMLGVVFVLLWLLRLKPLIAEVGWRHFSAYTALVLVALVALVMMVDPVRSITRWREWAATAGPDSRLETARFVVKMLPEGGFFGFGPGSFNAAYNERVVASGQKPLAIWKYAHNDPLQYIFEWGWLGGLAWAVIWLLPLKKAFGNLLTAAQSALGLEPKRSRRSRQRWEHSYESLRRHLLQGVSIALIGVLVHSCIDFPLQIMSLQLWAVALAGILMAVPSSATDSRG